MEFKLGLQNFEQYSQMSNNYLTLMLSLSRNLKIGINISNVINELLL